MPIEDHVKPPDFKVLIPSSFNQIALYWESTAQEKPDFLLVRWEDRQERFMEPDGNESISSALVYLRNTHVKLGGYLFLVGKECKDVSTYQEARFLTEAKKIRQIERIPNLRNATQQRRAIL